MSRLTPTKEMTDFQLQAALDIIANHTMTLGQAEKLTRSITICEGESIWAPDIDTVADEFYSAKMAARRDDDRMYREELPYMGATIGADDQPSWSK